MMDFIDEMKNALGMDLSDFKTFIDEKIKVEPDYLEQLFWLRDGSQMTLLKFLIEVYQEDLEAEHAAKDIRDKIDLIVSMAQDINIGEPLHHAIAAGKIQLALHLLGVEETNEPIASNLKFSSLSELFTGTLTKAQEYVQRIKTNCFELNRCDGQGRTLLSLILSTRNLQLLFHFLIKKPNLHVSTAMTNAQVPFQPIHQAVVLDYADGVRLLGHQGANLSNPLGIMRDTPVLLAARLCKIDALEALLELPVEKLHLEATNKHLFADQLSGHTAIEELCMHLKDNQSKAQALRGIAMLLCRGAEPPQNEEMRYLLSSEREELLKAVHAYMEDKPELVDAFVNRCHLTESPLHYIIYADHSWGSSIRHLFGIPSRAAFTLEELVVKKYSNPLQHEEYGEHLSTAAGANFSQEKNPLKLYAEFVRRYNKAYDEQSLPNPWSTMRWLIAEGRCDWDTVLRYAKTARPNCRTRIILGEMFPPVANVHENLDPESGHLAQPG